MKTTSQSLQRSLAKEAKPSTSKSYTIDEILNELERSDEGMTENEFYKWWNKNKNSL